MKEQLTKYQKSFVKTRLCAKCGKVIPLTRSNKRTCNEICEKEHKRDNWRRNALKRHEKQI